MSQENLKKGDDVIVRSAEEISTTLDHSACCRGIQFMEEMKSYCGSRQVVFKRVESYLDERDYKVKRIEGVVILDGLHCNGTKGYEDCERSCFLFWCEEWLLKAERS